MSDENQLELIPLFPVPLVMLPGEVMGLHIFEPRYQEMVEYCQENPGPAGDFIVLFEDKDQTAEVGCVVEFLQVMNETPDGSRDILVRGIRRVRVVKRHELHAYSSAQVESVQDREDVPLPEDSPLQLYAMHRQLILRTNGDEPPNSFYEREGSLAYVVGACSGMDVEPRLALLRADSEAERQLLVIAHLKDLLPLVSQVFPVIQHALGGYALISQVDQFLAEGRAG